MKALTLWQPWATLLATGVKGPETRSWGTSYRGPLLIHAAAGQHFANPSTVGAWRCYRGGKHDGPRMYHQPTGGVLDRTERVGLPLGAVVATAVLDDCVPMVARCDWPAGGVQHLVVTDDDLQLHAGYLQQSIEAQRPYGDFRPGRWAWLFSEVRALPEPVPARGRQGLWNPSPELVQQVLATAT